LLAAVLVITVQAVSYAQFGGLGDAARRKAVETLTNGVMKELEKKFTEIVAKEPLSAAAKAIVVKKLCEISEPTVRETIDRASSGKLPNVSELTKTVLDIVSLQVPALVEAAITESGGAAVAQATEQAPAVESAPAASKNDEKPPPEKKPQEPKKQETRQPKAQASGDSSDSNRNDAKLWTLGVSMGSTFKAPLIIGTIHGTLAPFRYSFLELGMDVGGVIESASVKYFSLYPFVNYAAFVPFGRTASGKRAGGWYAGAGGGVMFARYRFDFDGDVDIWNTTFAMNIVTGFHLLGFLDISYTFRTNFESADNKLSVGFVYRFK